MKNTTRAMRTMQTMLLGCIAGIALTIASAASAQTHTPLAADQIKMMVEHKLNGEDGLKNVKVSVQGQVVTLNGTVPSLWAKEKAIEETRKVEDVDTVVSNLTITAAESDEVVGSKVAERIRRYVFYSIFDNVDINVNDGSVTLTGQVVQPYRATDIARLASRVAGVREVNNRIDVLPVSIYDDEIRASIASRIYGHSLFINYATQVNPPIHIVVNNGRVTLTGVVNSEVERRMAEVIARETFGVFSVENKLRSENRSTRR